MTDLWDAEFKEVDRGRGITLLAAIALTLLAGYAEWDWRACVVLFISAALIGLLLVKRIEIKYDRIRLETKFRADEKAFGLGWDTKEDAESDLASAPIHKQHTHCVMRYFNEDGRERWAISNKRKYWRDAERQARDEAKAQNQKPTTENS